MSRCRIITADVTEWAASYDGAPFHALLCDPPYHLTSIVKRFGGPNAAPVKLKQMPGQSGLPYARGAKGFMGKTWDGGDIAFRPETWAALWEHLHPGAFIMAFAGSRGWHRQAVAIEDAGFIIHPMIGWIFGSGFPKATRIDRAVDRAAGVEYEQEEAGGVGFMTPEGKNGYNATKHRLRRVGEASEMGKAWEGHRYGLQALKPALEPIIVAQKAYEGKPIDCITRTGAGALNIDKGRIGCAGGTSGAGPGPAGLIYGGNLNGKRGEPVDGMGRWPANVAYHENIAHKIRTADSFFYEAKAGREERDAGLSGYAPECAFGVGALRDGGRGSAGVDTGRQNGSLGKITDPRYNIHPTVKPVDLCRWLALLLLPPAEYAPRRILIPFAGSGSEMAGAQQAGWDEIVGIEREAEYAEIAEGRLTALAAQEVLAF